MINPRHAAGGGGSAQTTLPAAHPGVVLAGQHPRHRAGFWGPLPPALAREGAGSCWRVVLGEASSPARVGSSAHPPNGVEVMAASC